MSDFDLPEDNTILSGPYWPEPVRVVKASLAGDSVRIQAVPVTSTGFFDLTIPIVDFQDKVRQLVAGIHTFDASPRLNARSG